MARRALDFATAHPVADSGFTAILTNLASGVEKADAVGMLQASGPQRQHAAVVQRLDVKHSIHSSLLRRLCRVAQLNSAAHPELKDKFTLPPGKSANREFILKAQQMLDDATAQQDLLKTLGLGDTFIADLTTEVNAFDSSTEDAHAGRADHIGASAQIDTIATTCVANVDVLDTYMQRAYAGDLQTLAAWDAATTVHAAAEHAEATPADAPPVPAPAPQPVVELPEEK